MDRSRIIDLLDRLHSAQQRWYAGRGDADELMRVLDPDIRWHVPGDNRIAGDYRGLSEVLDYFERRRAQAGNTLRLLEGQVLTGAIDAAAVLRDGSAVIDGREHTWSTVGLYRFRDDRVTSCHLLPLDLDAFDRVWS